MSVFVAGAAAALVVPRPVFPREVPVPIVAPRLAAEVVREDVRGAADAREHRSPAIARLGDAFRGVGRAEIAGDPGALERALTELKLARADAAPLGDDALAELRAYQTESFLAAAETYESSGDRGAFGDLGGSLLVTLRENGWVDEATHALEIDRFELRALFKARYGPLLSLSGPRFAISTVERAAILRLCIRLPAQPPGAHRGDPSARAFADAWLLERLAESEHDVAGYPFALARGIVHLRNQRYAEARRELGAATEASDAPYSLRAFNHLRAAFTDG